MFQKKLSSQNHFVVCVCVTSPIWSQLISQLEHDNIWGTQEVRGKGKSEICSQFPAMCLDQLLHIHTKTAWDWKLLSCGFCVTEHASTKIDDSWN